MARKVAVIGAGGMGSWFAQFFASRGDYVVVSDRDQSKARRLASRIGVKHLSNNVEAAGGSDIIILATPAHVLSSVVKEILPALRRNALLFDICAIKSAVIPALRSAERHGVQVASIHPMFGPLASGLRGRVMIVVRTGRNMRGTNMVKRLFREARILVVEPKVHDKWMAVTLALPHFLNMAFATSISTKGKLRELKRFAGRTFNLQMLLAEAVAGEPETTTDIQIMNKEFGITLRQLQRDIQSLARIVRSRDRAELITHYKRVRDFLSTDPDFNYAQRRFEQIYESYSTISKE